MAVRIRLKRLGQKNRPFYRVVVQDSRAPRNGRFIEELGTYNPLLKEDKLNVNAERAQYWIGTGAKPTDTVGRLFKESGVLEAKSEEDKLEERLDSEVNEESAQEENTEVAEGSSEEESAE